MTKKLKGKCSFYNNYCDVRISEIFEVEWPQWQNWRISCTDYVDSTHRNQSFTKSRTK